MVTAIEQQHPPAEARPYLALGRRIAALRADRHLSQRDLAHLAGISDGYVPKIERGLNRPDPAILRDLARVLGSDEHELLQLAGYVVRDRSIYAESTEQASALQRLARFPIAVLDRLVQIGDIIWYEDLPQQGQGNPEQEGHNDGQPDEQDTGAAGRR